MMWSHTCIRNFQQLVGELGTHLTSELVSDKQGASQNQLKEIFVILVEPESYHHHHCHHIHNVLGTLPSGEVCIITIIITTTTTIIITIIIL